MSGLVAGVGPAVWRGVAAAGPVADEAAELDHLAGELGAGAHDGAQLGAGCRGVEHGQALIESRAQRIARTKASVSAKIPGRLEYLGVHEGSL